MYNDCHKISHKDKKSMSNDTFSQCFQWVYKVVYISRTGRNMKIIFMVSQKSWFPCQVVHNGGICRV